MYIFAYWFLQGPIIIGGDTLSNFEENIEVPPTFSIFIRVNQTQTI